MAVFGTLRVSSEGPKGGRFQTDGLAPQFGRKGRHRAGPRADIAPRQRHVACAPEAAMRLQYPDRFGDEPGANGSTTLLGRALLAKGVWEAI
ncbi:hypothetical protein DUT91_16915 [Phyllobacterium salinisoli]|uniref:Uncharacterized protein n=1 Tax=Phyllobacterium salinisoli TaxID=1899321 RepID=A0A368JZM2_9HYPH|nr:hypothetical protein DUT91_16915 [Phyllobacterium salinisoli]